MGIYAHILRRLLLMIPMLLGVTLVVFVVSHAVPTEPLTIILDRKSLQNPEIRQAAIEKWGLDKSLPEQYLIYLANLAQGDLGLSFKTKRPVAQDLREYVPATVELAMVALVFSVTFGLPLGIVAALKAGTWVDHVARFISLLGASMPPFWSGLVVLFLLYFKIPIFPGPGRFNHRLFHPEIKTGLLLVDSLLAGNLPAFGDALKHLILPAVILGWFSLALIARITRSSLLEVLQMDYIRTAYAKGLTRWRVTLSHALRNAVIPTVTILGLEVAWLLTGSVMVETIFAWPGIGRYAVDSARVLDYPAVMGATLLISTIFMASSLGVDILYSIIDPRIREV
jgi:peptide/nickel transport system permease protein